jgi:LacI family transcriptional regulator
MVDSGDDGAPRRRPVTLTDVAVRAGVSQPTASRVLNGSARTPAPATAERVRQAAEELGYTPNAQAQALSRATTGVLGLVVHDIADPYFSVIVSGIHQAAADRQRHVMLAVSSHDPDAERRCVEAFIAHRTDAIIMVGSRSTTAAAAAAAERLIAIVSRYTANGGRFTVVGQPFPGADAVVPDNRGGAAALAEALLSQGTRDFVLLSGPAGLQTAEERTAGFLGALDAHGVRPVAVRRGEFTRDGGHEAARAVIAEAVPGSRRPVCLVATNDVMAVGAMTAVREAGLRVPADIQVAGFDDIPTLRDVSPGLTTVQLPLKEMGEHAVQLALGQGSPQIVAIPATVVLRDSTGPVPADDAIGAA